MKILLIVKGLPWPPTSGGAQRTALLHEALSFLGEVSLLQWSHQGRSAAKINKTINERRFVRFLHVVRTPWLWKILKLLPGRFGGSAAFISLDLPYYTLCPRSERWLAEYVAAEAFDIVVSRYADPALQSGMASLPKSVRRIVDLDDVPWGAVRAHIAAGDYTASLSRRILAWLRPFILERNVRPVLRRMDHLWVAKQADLDDYGSAGISVLPNIPFGHISPSWKRPESDAPIILFVGTVDYPPNRDGLDWFISNVWPSVLRAVPGVQLKIVGGTLSGTPPDLECTPGVVYVGRVDDLAEAYAECAFTIAPVLWGGGTKIKVIESLAYGRSCVVTAHASEGYESTLRDGESLLIRSCAESFADACVDLLGNPEKCESLAKAGCRVVGNYYTHDVFYREVKTVVDRLVGV
jgi:glycosyltransferase involved in cell wall biosynthesis